jgi:LysR family transcriptional regulator, glycine cleavage system transcriptional activator
MQWTPMAELRLPSTTALACFEAAARLGSFTRAAGEVHLTQAAVSRQVLGLEQRLQVRLFERRREALRLTEAGQAYLDDVRPALQRLERATTHVAAFKGRGGRLSLSVASSLGSYWLIPRLPSFTHAHPEITLNIATRIGPADFSAATIDASLEFGPGQRAGMVADFVLPLLLQPHASPGWVRRHGRSLDSSTPATSLPEAWPRWCEAAGVVMPGRTNGPAGDARQLGPRHDLMSLALHAALAGLGVALLPAFMTDQAVAARQLLRLSRKAWQADRAYWLVVPHEAAERPAVVTFRRWLLAVAAAGV